MPLSLLLRYFRLLIWYAEARLNYLLSRALAETLHLLWVGIAALIALLCLSAALLLALSHLLSPPMALLLTGLLWGLIAIISAFFLRPWLYKRFQTGRHLYRMTLARAGLRLMEKNLLSRPPQLSPSSSLVASLLPLLSQWIAKWLKTRIRQLLRKISPL
jgi:membrane protein implicated in regulation of membrane protease activity